MTPFMVRVAEAVESQTSVAGKPAVRPSVPRPFGPAADEQVAIRSLAEQLVCEANAVLADDGQQMVLRDEVGDGRLAFTVSYGSRRTHISTRFADHVATARLHGIGARCHDQVELAGPDQLESLLLLLLAGPAKEAPGDS